MLGEIEAGTRPRSLLPWVPLMAGGCEPAFIDRWKVVAETEADVRRRSEFAVLATLFAGKAGCKARWEDKLRGWNLEVPSIVEEWIAESDGRMLLRVAALRFGPAPAETEAAIRAITKPDRLERMVVRLVNATATGWDDLVATT